MFRNHLISPLSYISYFLVSLLLNLTAFSLSSFWQRRRTSSTQKITINQSFVKRYSSSCDLYSPSTSRVLENSLYYSRGESFSLYSARLSQATIPGIWAPLGSSIQTGLYEYIFPFRKALTILSWSILRLNRATIAIVIRKALVVSIVAQVLSRFAS